MKSKLFLIMAAALVALTIPSVTSAQGRPEKQPEKVSLPCEVDSTNNTSNDGPPKPAIVTLKAEIKNNTGAWLAEGRIIYFQLSFKDNLTYSKALDAMIPDGSSAKIWETFMPSTMAPHLPTCVAWYLK